ncbi:cupin domain-containing protein [Streptomyces roseifaciens]|uniref:cupin domain-containing protein n=1 Tax=Streptomyces roseifaciens TaxID=1488406 RepID=UPI000717E828|nr:cupin domain-containing protein [Streptomyces roseifaciens]
MENRQETGLIVRPEEAEYVTLPHRGGFRLLADAGDTGGALGANHLALGEGADGARPHYHALSTELFYVLDGRVEFLVGEERVSVGQGGMVVVPPKVAHAFGAAAGCTAELLAVLTPGVDRFGYFRALGRIQHGLDSFDSLLPEQARYDVHFLEAAAWRPARTT